MKTIKKIVLIVFGVGISVFLLIQLIPYGHDHTNPAVIAEPVWDSTQTQDLTKRACYDCHSNEVVYPWYSNVAPVSWLVQHDIEDGRRRLNFSDWKSGSQRARHIADDIGEVISSGKMPMPIYLIMHPNAKLSDLEKQALISGLTASLK